MWKLSDFGITVEAVSNALSTRLARGTPCYQATELVREIPTYNRYVDIWGLGCILYEVATGERAFRSEWAVVAYANGSTQLPHIASPWPFWDHHMNSLVQLLLSRQWQDRPPASIVRKVLFAYDAIVTLNWSRHFHCAAPSFSTLKSNLESSDLCARLVSAEDNLERLEDIWSTIADDWSSGIGTLSVSEDIGPNRQSIGGVKPICISCGSYFMMNVSPTFKVNLIKPGKMWEVRVFLGL